MILRIAREKVGHRQGPISQTPNLHPRLGVCICGPWIAMTCFAPIRRHLIHAKRGAGSRGRLTTKRVPSCASERTSMIPPCAWTISRQMYRPNPRPLGSSRGCADIPRTSGSKIRWRSRSEITGPRLRTSSLHFAVAPLQRYLHGLRPIAVHQGIAQQIREELPDAAPSPAAGEIAACVRNFDHATWRADQCFLDDLVGHFSQVGGLRGNRHL